MTFRCDSCGYSSPKWMGFCPQCKSQDGLVEAATPARRRRGAVQAAVPIPLTKVGETEVVRLRSAVGEFDRVLGGGFVPGGVVLVGGEPGVGKSTLLLQVAGAMVESGARVLIATAEESADQVGLRAARLGIDSEQVLLLAADDVDGVIEAAGNVRPDLLIVDSIQTMAVPEVGSPPGSVGQVRECSARLIRFAKEQGIATVLIGHVTKDGNIAGPKMLEHMVDVVLYLEGETDRGFRTVHGLKNRFGATHLVGLFEMRTDG
ncbi:MAG: DNA repair protein RadA, partial [Acidimicrobiia bacterium]|nr:DNA repair protein RadA [Acidimicrobiia bacterium]